jgi:hypothetical protein
VVQGTWFDGDGRWEEEKMTRLELRACCPSVEVYEFDGLTTVLDCDNVPSLDVLETSANAERNVDEMRDDQCDDVVMTKETMLLSKAGSSECSEVVELGTRDVECSAPVVATEIDRLVSFCGDSCRRFDKENAIGSTM